MSKRDLILTSKLRVIKLGGSLLNLPDLNERFRRWCDDNPHPLNFVIVGGGGVVDAVRDIDRVNGLPESFAHWLCIDLLRHTARLAHQILDNVDIYETMDLIQLALSQSNSQSTGPVTAIVQVHLFFNRTSRHRGLPESWEVTSDAIAAEFAQLYSAEEIVLMKSCDPPGDDSQVDSFAAARFVDAYFADRVAGIERVRFVNLRADSPALEK